MSEELKNKASANAKHFRYLSRALTFQRNRKGPEELDYLKHYSPQQRQAIILSLDSPIPNPLPPLAPHTISYYRRSSQPIFRTRIPPTLEIDGHMVYQSLWILASLEEKEFENYQFVVKEFQQELHVYLSADSTDIRQMAVMAAGNKIIGREPEIMRIVERDPNQLWILINHIYEKKISLRVLLQFLGSYHQIAFKTLYELTNNKTANKQDQSITALMEDEKAIESVIEGLRNTNPAIQKYSIRIIGNIIAEQSQYTDTLNRYKFVSNLFDLLQSSNDQLRRDTCWLLSNLCCERSSATMIMMETKLLTKLVDLFFYEKKNEIQRQLTHIFTCIAHYGDKGLAITMFNSQRLLQICNDHLCIEDDELIAATLFLLNELVELGDNFKQKQGQNIFCRSISSMKELSDEISKLSYTQHDDISDLCLKLITSLEQNQQNQL